jgi:hypothetical protein
MYRRRYQSRRDATGRGVGIDFVLKSLSASLESSEPDSLTL